MYKRAFLLSLLCLLAFVLIFLPHAEAQSCNTPPSGPADDCNNSGVKDSCELGSGSFVLFDGGVLGVPSNDCKVDGQPDDCSHTCYNGINSVDADGDGTSNCQEIWDETDPCDKGSHIARLNPRACGSPNGFFNQINVATVINTSFANLRATVSYFDASGAQRGAVTNELQPNQKWDVIVNELGLLPDTLGTVCVDTGGSVQGLWTGGLTIYKLRETNDAFGTSSQFDYALYYPFTNAIRGSTIIPVNTNFPLEANTRHTVANWIRLYDGDASDAQPLRGVLSYFNNGGALLGSTFVEIPNGGRQDFGAHAVLGPNAIGFAEFAPETTGVPYFAEATRYFYEGEGAASTKFYAAFPIIVQPLSGAKKSAPVDAGANEFSVVEMLNGTASALSGASAASLEVFQLNGASVFGSQNFEIPAKGTLHRIVSGVPQTAADTSFGEVGGPPESLSAAVFTYGFGSGTFLYGYSVPMTESPGPRQVSEFNTFIGHSNTLRLVNTSSNPMKVNISMFDYTHTLLALPPELVNLTLGPKEMKRVRLDSLPTNSYGTIAARTEQSRVGLVMVNEISRAGAYVMPFVGR